MKQMYLLSLPFKSLNGGISMRPYTVCEKENDVEKEFMNYANYKIVDSEKWLKHYKEKEETDMVEYKQKELDFWIMVREQKIYGCDTVFYK